MSKKQEILKKKVGAAGKGGVDKSYAVSPVQDHGGPQEGMDPSGVRGGTDAHSDMASAHAAAAQAHVGLAKLHLAHHAAGQAYAQVLHSQDGSSAPYSSIDHSNESGKEEQSVPAGKKGGFDKKGKGGPSKSPVGKATLHHVKSTEARMDADGDTD